MTPKNIYVNDAYLPFFEFEGRYVFMRGGAGSGKSVAGAQKKTMKVSSRPGRRVLVIRKVATTLRQSVFEQLRKVIGDWDLTEQYEVNQTILRLRNTVTGSEFICAGIDDPEKLKSITGITDVLIEEGTELTEDDFDQIDLRLRDVEDGQIVLMFNPISESHWLKKRIDAKQGSPDTLVVLTTFQDNKFLPKSYVETLLNMAATNPNYHRIYVLNEWGRIETGQEFYFNFNRQQHVGKVDYAKGPAIFTAYDANVLPYSAMLCCQPQREGDLLTLRFFREYAVPPPQGGVRPTARKFFADWKNAWCGSDVFITGDATLRKREPGQTAERATLFEDVQGEMQAAGAWTPYADRWLRKNPSVARRGGFINAILAGGIPGVRIIIDESCSELIADLEQVQTGPEGDKFKPKTRDKATGQSYELRGHQSDCFDYIICTICEAQYEQFKAGR